MSNRSPDREPIRDSIAALTGIAAIAVAALLSGCAMSGRDEAESPRTAGDGVRTAGTTAGTGGQGPALSSDASRPGPTAAPANMQYGQPGTLPGWNDDMMEDLRPALDGQCGARRTPLGWTSLCAELATLPRDGPAALRAWIAKRFVAEPLTAKDGGTTGLVTGYHEPELRGSRHRTSRFTVPLYRAPAKAHPAARASRAAIERGRLLAGHELVWLDDPVDAFFLQVQGSGRIRLDDGTLMRVGYAGNNGQRYRAIGAVLVQRGALVAGEVDAPKIKAWLRSHPGAATEVMRENPRYVFFRELDAVAPELGPPGSLGVPLTPLRSIAVDPARVPAGALVWLETTDPVDGSPLRRMVVAQDTGAAIVGAVRADLFWGTGPRAETAAGLMKQPGRLWVLSPKPASR